MQTLTSTVDILYDAIIRLMVRIVRGYIYADVAEEIHEETEEELVTTMQISEPVVKEEVPIQAEQVTATVVPKAILERGVVMYAGAPHVPIYKNPVIEFDAVIGAIDFGSMVIAGEPKGRFLHVVWNEITGWVLRDDLADRAAHTYPIFKKDEENLVDDKNTALVRAIIKDEFGLGKSEFPLQAGEYILYKLWRRGLSISWPPYIKPRVPGIWHALLKGQKGIRAGLTPKVGSIMEYTMEGEIGHLAYIEAIFPDHTMSVSEVNNPDSGMYSEREIRKDEWRELHPVFIDVAQT